MASTVYTPGVVITSAWLNDVNTSTYGLIKFAPLYGVKGDGVTDDTIAINALLATGGKIEFNMGTHIHSTPLLPVNNSFIIGRGAATIFRNTGATSISNFACNAKSRIVFRDFALATTTPLTGTSVAGIDLLNTSHCIVDNITMTSLAYNGIWIRGVSQHNSVRKCTTITFNGTAANQDSADVSIMGTVDGAPQWNVLDDNKFTSGSQHGVLIQDPYLTPYQAPTNNIVINNEIGNHTVYGVVVYQPGNSSLFTGSQSGTTLTVTAFTLGNPIAVGMWVATVAGQQMSKITALGTGTGGTGTYTLSQSQTVASTPLAAGVPINTNNTISNNYIHDIQGLYNISSGMGVYLAGINNSGTQILNNKIDNCCISTLSQSLAAAAITINGSVGDLAPVLIDGNTITGQTKYDGIRVSTLYSGNITMVNNTVIMPAANVTGDCVSVHSSYNVSVVNNKLTHLNTTQNNNCIFVFAEGQNMDVITILGNEMRGAANYVQVTQSGGFAVTGLKVVGNTGRNNNGLGNGGINFNNTAVSNAVVSDNDISSVSTPALYIATASNVRVGRNMWQSTGTNAINLSGTCTGSFYESNNTILAGVMNDTSTGFFKEVLQASAAPSTGTWAVPARAHNATGTVGQPKGWRLTTAGSPGTWTSEGNL